MKKIATRLAALLCAAAMTFTLSGCGSPSGAAGNSDSAGQSSTQTTQSGQAQKSTLAFGITAEPSTLDPSPSPDFMTHMMQFQLYDWLV